MSLRLPLARGVNITELGYFVREFESFSYAFRSDDRVIGIYGKLDISANGSVFLGDLMMACAFVLSPVMRSQIEGRYQELFLEAGWSAVAGDNETTLLKESWESMMCIPSEYAAHVGELVFRAAGSKSLGLLEWEFDMHSHMPNLGKAPTIRESYTGARVDGRVKHVDQREFTDWIKCRRLVVYTGAGLSAESGIPGLVGPNSLDTQLGLFEKFPGQLINRLINDPSAVAQNVGDYQMRFITASPNSGHYALAKLEAIGKITCLLTSNFDRLHERAGTVSVHRIDKEKALPISLLGFSYPEILLVVGVSEDEFDLIANCRECGVEIAVINPVPPRYLSAGDMYCSGRAEEVLPRLLL